MNKTPKKRFAKTDGDGEYVDDEGNYLDLNQICWNCMAIVEKPHSDDWGTWGLCDNPKCLEAKVLYWACHCRDYYFQPTLVKHCNRCGANQPKRVPMMRMREIVLLHAFWHKEAK